jgi:predicted dehydrogenase
MPAPLRVGFVGCGRFATQQIYPSEDDITRVEYHAPSGQPDGGDFVTDGVTIAEATAWNAGVAIGYAHELRHFAAAIRGETAQEATLEDGLRQMEISEEIRRQAEEASARPA